MAKKQQYINKIFHSRQGSWHVYEILLAGRYGWEYMLASARYIAEKDLSHMDSVTRTEHIGAKEQEMLHAVTASGGIALCPELKREGSSLSVAGRSKSLNTMTKITWVNQTRVMRILTLAPVNDLIESYLAALIERKLPLNTKKLLTKAKNKTSDFEKRFGAKILVFLGGVWTAGGLLMLAVLDGFFPMGIMWFVMSIGFLLWGTYILGQTKKKTGTVLVEKPVVHKPEPEKAAKAAPQSENMWIVVNKLFPVLPFTAADGSVRLYKDKMAAQRYINHKSEYPLAVLSLPENQLDICKEIWLKAGIKRIDIYTDDINYTSEKTGDMNYIGDGIAALLLQIKQHSAGNGDKNLLAMEYDMLKKELQTTPLLIPMIYDNDNIVQMSEDKTVHMTNAANIQLSALLRGEDNQPKNPIPSYLGTKLLTGDRFGIIWNGNKVLYYGGMDIMDKPVDNSTESAEPAKDKVMHGFFADNQKNGTHMLAVFTNMKDLRAMYPDKRVARFSFNELAAMAKEGDGIVFDPGAASLCFEMNHEMIDKMK